jgi:hypothetical protein
MAWLEEHVERLRQLAAELPAGAPHCRDVLGELVREIGARHGVQACFACHDGLLVETAGVADFEALAAMSQRLIEAGQQPALHQMLGPARQALVSGTASKLALLIIEPFTVGVVASARERLAKSLAR